MPIATPLSLSLHPPLPSKSIASVSPSPSRPRFPAAVLSPFTRHHKSSQSPSHPSTPLPPTPTASASSTARPGEDLTNFIWDLHSIPDDSRPGRPHWEHERALAEVTRFYSSLIQRNPPPLPSTLRDPVVPPQPPSPPMSAYPRSPAATAAAAFCRRLQPKLQKTCTRHHQSSSGKCSASCSSDSSYSEISFPSPPLTRTISDGPASFKRKPKKFRGGGPSSSNTSSASAYSDLHDSSTSHYCFKSSYAGLSEPEVAVELESEPEALVETRIKPIVMTDVPTRTSSIRHTRSLGRLKAGRTKISKKDYVIFNKSNVKV